MCFLMGIESDMTNEFGNPIGLAIVGGAAVFTWPEVLVDEADYARASEIAQAFIEASKERGGAEPVPAGPAEWRCPACGESVEGSLLACWKCDTARPGE